MSTQTPLSPTQIAEQAAIERFLNSYLRETGLREPRASVESLSAAGIPREVIQAVLAEGAPMLLPLPRTGGALVGVVAWASSSGHHRFGSRLWHQAPAGGGPVESAARLAHLLVAELAAGEPEEALRHRRSRELLSQVTNSIDKTALYVERRLRSGLEALDLEAPGAFVAAEQRLLLGHPFHPTPKSSEGFTTGDLEHYAPELGASFPLHYLAVRPELVQEDFLPGGRDGLLPPDVRSEALARWSPVGQDWRLLPCHPWQARELRRSEGFQALVEEGRVVELGPLGAPVHPTSSVRTVLVEGHPFFFKLPLGVRITHFVRTNPPEQLARSLDASRVVAALRAESPHPDFTILLEVGWRALSPPGWKQEARQALAGSTGVLFREAPSREGAHPPLVVAALLEPAPDGSGPLLVRAVRRAAGRESGPLDPASVRAWLRRYLQVSLAPLLTHFVRDGLSLEAHVQNSLVSLVGGWPARFYVRDLEGTSLSRERAARRGLHDGLLPESSPLLYDEAEAWQRLLYYFFVNHLGHLLATLSHATAIPEPRLWGVVRESVESMAGTLRSAGGGRYAEELLDGPTWPAKANLLSRLLERGERPLYVPISNPLRKEEVSPWN